jgi:hypothetical protein
MSTVPKSPGHMASKQSTDGYGRGDTVLDDRAGNDRTPVEVQIANFDGLPGVGIRLAAAEVIDSRGLKADGRGMFHVPAGHRLVLTTSAGIRCVLADQATFTDPIPQKLRGVRPSRFSQSRVNEAHAAIEEEAVARTPLAVDDTDTIEVRINPLAFAPEPGSSVGTRTSRGIIDAGETVVLPKAEALNLIINKAAERVVPEPPPSLEERLAAAEEALERLRERETVHATKAKK